MARKALMLLLWLLAWARQTGAQGACQGVPNACQLGSCDNQKGDLRDCFDSCNPNLTNNVNKFQTRTDQSTAAATSGGSRPLQSPVPSPATRSVPPTQPVGVPALADRNSRLYSIDNNPTTHFYGSEADLNSLTALCPEYASLPDGGIQSEGYDGYYYAANASAFGDAELDMVVVSTATCNGGTMYVWDALVSTGLSTQCETQSTGARHLLGKSSNELEASMASLLSGHGFMTHERTLKQMPDLSQCTRKVQQIFLGGAPLQPSVYLKYPWDVYYQMRLDELDHAWIQVLYMTKNGCAYDVFDLSDLISSAESDFEALCSWSEVL